jgi:hypothetical protein
VGHILKQNRYYLLVLFCVSALMYGVFHYRQFGTSDEVRYAIGLKSSYEETENFFNYEMSFGYYLFLRPVAASIPTEKLPLFMNIVSSFIGVLILVPLFLLVQSLFSQRVGFFTGLFLVYVPSFWYFSRCGHPGVMALFFFLVALFLFNQALLHKNKSTILLGASILFAVGSLLMRADYLIWFLAPLGLVLYRKGRNKKALTMFFLFISISVLGYMAARWGVLGYLFQPGGGTVVAHVQKRIISLSFMAKSSLKNTGLFVFGVLPVVAVCFLLSFIHMVRNRKWRLLRLVVLWGAPVFVFLPFQGMAFARLTVPALPPLLMVTMSWIDRGVRERYRYVVPIALLFLAHLMPLLTQPLFRGKIPAQVHYKGKPVLSMPIGSIFSDFYHKGEYLETLHDVARKVTQERKRDVMILSDSVHRSWYRYELLITRGADCSSREQTETRSFFMQCDTPENQFGIFLILNQSSWEEFARLMDDQSFADVLFHVTPFLLDHPRPEVFYERDQFLSYLKANLSYRR